jgi:hypothetical protein
MNLTFSQTSRLLDAKVRQEAERCVKVYGKNGAGDPFAARYIDACAASYVLACVERAVITDGPNPVTRELHFHLAAALS